ncbi:MAG TPA: hypothetical protein VHE13_05560 [Opitutus sp.]|nr:hypothetical protein [Opitutus sp.]
MIDSAMQASRPPISPAPANRRAGGVAPWWAKLLLAIAAPGLFFVLLEAGLRLADFGRDTRFFIPDAKPGYFRTNPRYTELFFPASFGLKPLNFRIAKAKPAGSYRVFVIGESAAMGVPEPGFALGPQLQAQLRAGYPGRRIDVFDLGITAIDSHVIRDIVRQAADFQPDLFVVYMGNNEVVGPYGPSSAVAARMPPRWLIRLSLWTRGTRTGQLVQRAVRALAAPGRDFKDWRGMETFKGNDVAADDPRMRTVYANFAANLADVVALARGAGAKVVLSTVAVNVRDCAPFVSLHGAGLTPARRDEWQEDSAAAARAAGLGDDARARTLLERAATLDPAYAETHYQLARLLDRNGDAAAARRQYLDALQWDALRFRADARINAIIRAAAGAGGAAVTLADAARALGSDAASTVAPAGHRFFFEHVHLTWEGNYALARTLVPVAGAALFGDQTVPAPWLTPEGCADELGFTAFGRATQFARMNELTDRPPFTGQSSFAADRSWLQGELAAATAAVTQPGQLPAIAAKIEAARRRAPDSAFANFQAAQVEIQAGNFAQALEWNGQLLAAEPPSAEATAQRAFLLLRLGRADEAEAALLAAAQSEPYYFQTYEMLARLWAETGRAGKALDYFAALVDLMPGSSTARHIYASLLEAKGDAAAAETQWRAILRAVPDDAGALAPLLARLEHDGKRDEALALMLAAHAYNPRNFHNNEQLVAFYEARGDTANTVKYLQELAASGPVNAQLYLDLASGLEKLGQRDEATIALRRAQATAAAQHDATAERTAAERLARRAQ